MGFIKKVWEVLKGKKTYIFTFIGAGLWGAHVTGLIDADTWQVLTGLDAFGIIASFRSAINTQTQQLK